MTLRSERLENLKIRILRLFRISYFYRLLKICSDNLSLRGA
jgi:hypothetical protein